MCCGGCNDKKLVLNTALTEPNCVWQSFDILSLNIADDSFLAPPSVLDALDEVTAFKIETYFDGCSSVHFRFSMTHDATFVLNDVDDRFIDFWNDLSALLPLLNGYTIDDLEINPLPAVITYYTVENLSIYSATGDVWVYKSGSNLETYITTHEPPIAAAKVANTSYVKIGFQITLPVTKTS